MRCFRSRARPTRLRSGIGPDSETVSTGNSATLISLTVGSSVASGRSDLAVSTFSRTSSSARALSKPAKNSSITEAWPSDAVLVTVLMPSMDRSSRSIGRTSSRSASSGEMPS